MSDTSGPTSRTPLAFFDPASCSWRTSQGTFLSDSMPSSLTLPRSGMTRSGVLYELPTSAPATAGPDCSSLPTPTAGDSVSTRNATLDRRPDSRHHAGTTLTDAVAKLLPTPMGRDGKGQPLPREGGDDLVTAVDRLLPTPQKRDGDHARGADPERYRGSKSQNGRRVNLDDMIAATEAGRWSGEPTDPPSPATPSSPAVTPLTLWTERDD